MLFFFPFPLFLFPFHICTVAPRRLDRSFSLGLSVFPSSSSSLLLLGLFLLVRVRLGWQAGCSRQRWSGCVSLLPALESKPPSTSIHHHPSSGVKKPSPLHSTHGPSIRKSPHSIIVVSSLFSHSLTPSPPSSYRAPPPLRRPPYSSNNPRATSTAATNPQQPPPRCRILLNRPTIIQPGRSSSQIGTKMSCTASVQTA